MLVYVNSGLKADPPRILDVTYEGKAYRFALLHTGPEIYQQHAALRAARIQPHAHDVYHLVVYTHGDNAFQFNGRTFPAKRGTVVWTSPGEPHAFGQCRAEAGGYLELTFQLMESESERSLPVSYRQYLELLTGSPLGHATIPFELDARAMCKIESGFAELHALFRRGSFDWLAVHREILGLFALFVSSTQSFHDHEKPVDPRIENARHDIERRFRGPLAVRDLAALACLSEGHFLRLFKKVVGLSPIEYQLELRIRAAATLLYSTTLTCKEIAAQVGFGDEYHFSRAFKKRMGRSPMHWIGRRPLPEEFPEYSGPTSRQARSLIGLNR